MNKKMLLIIAAVICVSVWFFSKEEFKTEDRPKNPAMLDQILYQPDEWLIKTANLSEPFAKMAVESKAEVVTAALNRHTNLPAIKQLTDAFAGQKFRSAIIEPNGAVIAVETFHVGEPLIWLPLPLWLLVFDFFGKIYFVNS